jgi:hypothetical protein
LYLLTGIAAALFQAVFNLNSNIPMVGASGAISGVLGFYLRWFPGHRIKVFMMLPPLVVGVRMFSASLVLWMYLIMDNIVPFLMASQGGGARQTRIHTITGSMFDGLELTKGHTPDKGADSLGGTINLKTRSPLSMREKRRMIYRVGAKWAPPFYDHNPATRNHSIHPMTSFSYQEVFDAFGGESQNPAWDAVRRLRPDAIVSLPHGYIGVDAARLGVVRRRVA